MNNWDELRKDIDELRNTMNELKAEWVRWKQDSIGLPPVNVHSGYSPNIWVEQDPRDKAKNLLKRL